MSVKGGTALLEIEPKLRKRQGKFNNQQRNLLKFTVTNISLQGMLKQERQNHLISIKASFTQNQNIAKLLSILTVTDSLRSRKKCPCNYDRKKAANLGKNKKLERSKRQQASKDFIIISKGSSLDRELLYKRGLKINPGNYDRE